VRRFIPHILLVLSGLACLATIWYFEPPIQTGPPRGVTKSSGHPPAELYVRLVADEEVQLHKLVVQIEWDDKLLENPRVWHAYRTLHLEPLTRIQDRALVLAFNADPGVGGVSDAQAEVKPIQGPGRLARLAFHIRNPKQPVPPEAIQVVSAYGFTATGERVDLSGIKLVRFTPANEPLPGGELQPDEVEP